MAPDQLLSFRKRCFNYGALQAGLDIAYGKDDIDFTCCGFDEMDEVQGSGSAELRLWLAEHQHRLPLR